MAKTLWCLVQRSDAAQVSFGTGNDMAPFNGAISAGSIYGGAGSDTLSFTGAVTQRVQRLTKEYADSVYFGSSLHWHNPYW